MDQREITIQSYQTTVLFDLEALKAGIDSAWLTPQIPFGVFARDRAKDHDSLSVVLGRVRNVDVLTVGDLIRPFGKLGHGSSPRGFPEPCAPNPGH